MGNWDYTTDFLIVGSGAGALTAAVRASDLHADVLVIEKSDSYGGTSAMSGGALWIPDNSLMAKKGIQDCEQDGFLYLSSLIKEGFDSERTLAFLSTGKLMVDYLLQHTHLQLQCSASYPDYYPDKPGSKSGGRTMEPAPFDALRLGKERTRLHLMHPQMYVMGMILITGKEAQLAGAGGFKAFTTIAKIVLGHFLNIPARMRSLKSTRLTLGNALIAALRLALMERDVPLWLKTSAEKLIIENNRIVGIEVLKEGKQLSIGVNKGVLLASGGFERNLEMRKQYQQPPWSTEWPATNLQNTGDGIRLGIEVGAKIGLMEHSWWMPTIRVPKQEISYILVFEKSMPFSIMVDQTGRRFVNESGPYEDVGREMRHNSAEGFTRAPSYLIFDKKYRHCFPIGNIQPSTIQPDHKLSELQKTELLITGNTLAELATKIGVPVENLENTINTFNQFARSGVDTDFQRGQNIYDRYYSIPSIKPNPNLGSISLPPYYAVRAYPGDIGTKGGLVTDCYARVVNEQGEPIQGLYATGNCSASIMGNSYPGAGSTLGPAMTFGFIAAEHAVS